MDCRAPSRSRAAPRRRVPRAPWSWHLVTAVTAMRAASNWLLARRGLRLVVVAESSWLPALLKAMRRRSVARSKSALAQAPPAPGARSSWRQEPRALMPTRDLRAAASPYRQGLEALAPSGGDASVRAGAGGLAGGGPGLAAGDALEGGSGGGVALASGSGSGATGNSGDVGIRSASQDTGTTGAVTVASSATRSATPAL